MWTRVRICFIASQYKAGKMGQISTEIQYSNDGCAVCSSGMFRGLLITSFIFAL